MYLSSSWDMLTRWEIAEPVRHRTPIPAALVRAMMTVALHWHWFRFSAALGCVFFGMARPGEVLGATREAPVLPSDLMIPGANTAYLKIHEPKGWRRGKGRIQHTSFSDPDAVLCAEMVFGNLPATSKLFPGSHGAFRRRWDAILTSLGVVNRASLTPGGLRGGGAVAAFQGGDELTKILWKMRLKHLATLESYLQEVTAETCLSKQPSQTKQRIFAAAEMLNASICSRCRPPRGP